MPDVIYCHQCAKDNLLTHKFCLDCATPLYLQGNPGDAPRGCPQCKTRNPSFAKFCIACSSPLVPAPDKGPGPDIPLVLNNRKAVGGEACPGCGRPADLLSQLVQQEGAKRTSYMGPDGLIVEKPSWLAWNLREPKRIPGQHKGMLSRFNSGCIVPIFILLVVPCLGIAALKTFFRSGILSNPLVFIVVFAVALGLAWASNSNRRKGSLAQAQFRWRQAHYCNRCDAVYVTGETLYTSPRNVEDILWHTPSQFA